jgi:membrane protein required for colicin V production
MTSFDWVVLCIIGLSTLLAFLRGVVREVIALAAWVLGLIGGIAFAPSVGAMLPEIPGHPALRYVIAFALIFIGALIVGGLIAWPLSRAIRAVGLGFVDRFLGSLFGFARGIAFVLVFVLIAGLTPLPRLPWWQGSAFAPSLVAAVGALAPYLPAELTRRLDYSPHGVPPKTAPVERQA